jgi:hypothetical protein
MSFSVRLLTASIGAMSGSGVTREFAFEGRVPPSPRVNAAKV